MTADTPENAETEAFPFETAPRLETDRLILRAHTLDDLDDCEEMWSDEAVVRHISGKAYNPEEVWGRMLKYRGHWPLMGYGFWMLEAKDSGRFLGEAGFMDFHREIEPSIEGEPEIGWALAVWAQGRGVATEVVKHLTEWSDENLDSERTVCMITPENTPSIRLAEKCGYKEFAKSFYREEPVFLFERPRGG